MVLMDIIKFIANLKKVLDNPVRMCYNKITKRKGIKKMDKRVNKKTGEELQAYLQFRRKASRVPSKKGKGSYKRSDFKAGR